jgi:hypothetical protein
LQTPLQQEPIGELGRFEFREPSSRKGVIIGAPQGSVEPDAAAYAEWLSGRIGAGLVVAYGFADKRISVSQPLVRSTPYLTLSNDPVRRGSVYREFKTLLQRTAQGTVAYYVGVRIPRRENGVDRVEVATSGFTFEELKLLKESYLRIRDRLLADNPSPKFAIAIDPLDRISWRVAGVKHHGVLMMAKRGLSLRLPEALISGENETPYKKILASWLIQVLENGELNYAKVPHVEVTVTNYGRIESIPPRSERHGVVIGAPHGTFDEYTAEMATQISYRTGLAAVIAKGFTPTERSGWRINVNRPTELRYPAGHIEIDTKRAAEVYLVFKRAVARASQHSLELYVDIHQNGRQNNIQVATVGVSRVQAKLIKAIYNEIRDRVLRSMPDVAAVNMVIEPLDVVEIGAWAAKNRGILSVAKQSLHFELPAYRILSDAKVRDAYTKILGELVNRSADLLLAPVDERMLIRSDSAMPGSSSATARSN